MPGNVRFIVPGAFNISRYLGQPGSSSTHRLWRNGPRAKESGGGRRGHQFALHCRRYNTSKPAASNASTPPTAAGGNGGLVEHAVRLSMAPLNGNVKLQCTRCDSGGAATTTTTTTTTVSKAAIASEFGLSPRDLQTIDLPSQGFPHILVRGASTTILFHMFDLRLLIQADKLLLFHIDGLADTTISQVFTYNLQEKLLLVRQQQQQQQKDGDYTLLHRKMSEAFELRALEAALAAVAAVLEARYRLARRDVGAALRDLDAHMATDKEQAGTSSVHTGLRSLLDMARRLADIEQQARLVRGALAELLREDRDMADLYLTDTRRTGRRHDADDHQEVEYLLEAYFRAHDAVAQEAAALMANVHRTADTVRSVLANRRNQIMILETKVEIAMLGMASATLVAGWYGMNTVNFFEESVYAFAVIVFGSVMGGGAIWWFLLRKLRSIRRNKM